MQKAGPERCTPVSLQGTHLLHVGEVRLRQEAGSQVKVELILPPLDLVAIIGKAIAPDSCGDVARQWRAQKKRRLAEVQRRNSSGEDAERFRLAHLLLEKAKDNVVVVQAGGYIGTGGGSGSREGRPCQVSAGRSCVRGTAEEKSCHAIHTHPRPGPPPAPCEWAAAGAASCENDHEALPAVRDAPPPA